MGDTDAAGILYFAAPYHWYDQMWVGYLHDIGRPLRGLLADSYGTPTVASSAEYLAAVGLDDELACELRPNHIGSRSFGLTLSASLPSGTEALRVHSRHVWCRITGSELESEELPPWLRERLVGSYGGNDSA
jgi:acyl-CoA thioesterase FadM